MRTKISILQVKMQNIWKPLHVNVPWKRPKVPLISFNFCHILLIAKLKARISHLLDQDKLRILMRAFIYTHFHYCPLEWMFHSRKLNNVNKLHERALRITHRDQNSSFESLLEKDSSTTIHVKNLKVMLTELFKTKNYQNSDFMREVYPLRNNSYNLRYNNEFLQPKVKAVSYGLETTRVRGSQLWQTLHSYKKATFRSKTSKEQSESGHSSDCHYRLC